MNQSNHADIPNRRAPASSASNKRNLIIGILGGFALILLAAVMIQTVGNSLSNGPVPTHIENRFVDFDQDGDSDFVQQADILFNCGGYYCESGKTEPPAPLATPASQAGQPAPTPQVYSDTLEPGPN